MTGATPPELLEWLNAELERRNISGAQASRLAGLNVGAISEIVNGRTPGLEVCKALASFFATSPEYVLRLAGHLPMRPDTPLDENARLQEFVSRLARLPARRQRRIMEAALLLLEVAEAVAHVSEEDVL